MNLLEAEFTLTEEKTRIIVNSLEPESTVQKERSETTVTAEGNKLRLRIEAQDLSALRAAVNTYFKWLVMCDELSD